jgi:hypothetical protein
MASTICYRVTFTLLRYGLNEHGIEVRFMTRVRDFFLLYSVQTFSGPTQSLVQWVTGPSFSGGSVSEA